MKKIFIFLFIMSSFLDAMDNKGAKGSKGFFTVLNSKGEYQSIFASKKTPNESLLGLTATNLFEKFSNKESMSVDELEQLKNVIDQELIALGNEQISKAQNELEEKKKGVEFINALGQLGQLLKSLDNTNEMQKDNSDLHKDIEKVDNLVKKLEIPQEVKNALETEEKSLNTYISEWNKIGEKIKKGENIQEETKWEGVSHILPARVKTSNKINGIIGLKRNKSQFKQYVYRNSYNTKKDPFDDLYQNFYRKVKEADDAITKVEYKHMKLQNAKGALEKAHVRHDHLITLIQEAEHAGDDEAFDEELQQIATKHEEPILKEQEEKRQKYHKKLRHFKGYEQEVIDATQKVLEAYQQLPQLIKQQLLEGPQQNQDPNNNNNNAVQKWYDKQWQLDKPLPPLDPEIVKNASSMPHVSHVRELAIRTDNSLAKSLAQEHYENIKAYKQYYDAYHALDKIRAKCKNVLDQIKDANHKPTPVFLPDDIEPSGTWQEEEILEVPRGTFIDGSKIRKRYTYTPHNVDAKNEKFIAAVVIHGTIGWTTPDYFDDNNPKTQNFRHIKRFLAWYAATHNQKVELTSYEWSGMLFNFKRRKAGESLTRYLQIPHYENADKVLLLGHSHGCNVANYVSHLIPEERAIELMIHWACPHRKEEYYQPAHCKQVLYFHSNADWIARLGRISVGREVKPAFMAFAHPALQLATRGLTSGLSQIPVFGSVLPHTLKQSLDNLIGAGINLSSWKNLSFFLNNIRELCTRTNNLIPQDNKIIAGYSLAIDGKKPGHSQVTDVAKALPEVIRQTHRKHFEAMTQNGTFDLSVEGYGPNLHVELFPIKKTRTLPPYIAEYLTLKPKKELSEVLRYRHIKMKKSPHNSQQNDMESLCKEHHFEEKFLSVELYEQDGASLVPVFNSK